MKVLDPRLSDSGGVQKTTSPVDARKRVDRGKAGGEQDKVELSGAGEQLAALKSAVADVPDVRMERVERIRAEIESGRYHPDANQIAEAMVRDALMYSKWGAV